MLSTELIFDYIHIPCSVHSAGFTWNVVGVLKLQLVTTTLVLILTRG